MNIEEMLEVADTEDTMHLEEMLLEGGALIVVDLSNLIDSITGIVNDIDDYLFNICVPSLELDIWSLEEDGCLKYYNVTADILEMHLNIVNSMIYEIGGYNGLYHCAPFKLVNKNMYYIMLK